MLDDSVQRLKDLAKDLREHDGRVLIKLRIDVNCVLADAVRDHRPALYEQLEVRTGFSSTPLAPSRER